MAIVNRQRRGTRPDGSTYTVSEYRYVSSSQMRVPREEGAASGGAPCRPPAAGEIGRDHAPRTMLLF
jgi:hypothetical protein